MKGEQSARHIKVGKMGEKLACQFLERRGHKIIDRNFLVRSGEIDIISEWHGTIYFCEVKTVAVDGTATGHRPEENVSPWKRKKLGRAVQVYLAQRFKEREIPWVFWVIAVKLDIARMTAAMKVIEDVL